MAVLWRVDSGPQRSQSIERPEPPECPADDLILGKKRPTRPVAPVPAVAAVVAKRKHISFRHCDIQRAAETHALVVHRAVPGHIGLVDRIAVDTDFTPGVDGHLITADCNNPLDVGVSGWMT